MLWGIVLRSHHNSQTESEVFKLPNYIVIQCYWLWMVTAQPININQLTGYLQINGNYDSFDELNIER